MAIPRTGQLGAAALGSLWLGAPPVWGGAVPRTTVHARSAISAAGPTAAVSAVGKPRSAVSADTARGGIS